MDFFSVKSAYKVYVEDRDRNKPLGNRVLLLLILMVAIRFGNDCGMPDCPKKMLHFMWRLCHNSLALRVNLKRRGVKMDDLGCVQM